MAWLAGGGGFDPPGGAFAVEDSVGVVWGGWGKGW